MDHHWHCRGCLLPCRPRPQLLHGVPRRGVQPHRQAKGSPSCLTCRPSLRTTYALGSPSTSSLSFPCRSLCARATTTHLRASLASRSSTDSSRSRGTLRLSRCSLVKVFKVVHEKSKLVKFLKEHLKIGAGLERLFFFVLLFTLLCHIVSCIWYASLPHVRRIFSARLDDFNHESWVVRYGFQDYADGEVSLAC